MSVGSRIKELRESKNISRNELADSVGVTVGAISNYENEVSSPKEPILFKIMESLKCDANYLFQDAIEMPSMKNSVSIEELHLVEKYRALDEHGKEMVDFTLTKEWERSIAIRELEEELISNTVQADITTPDEPDDTYQPTTLAAHFDGDKYTDDEMDEINQFTEFVKNRRK